MMLTAVIVAACEPSAPPRHADDRPAVPDQCDDIRVPSRGEINTNLDLAAEVLEVSYFVPSLGRDRTVRLPFGALGCLANDEVRELVGHALQATGTYHAACDNRASVAAYIDDDGRPDLVFHDWVDNRAVVGVCTQRSADTMPGLGQAEVLQVIDVEGDGREEILYGATTMSAEHLAVAVVVDGELHAVRDGEGRRLVLLSGLEVLRGIGRFASHVGVFGCDDRDDDGIDDLVQVMVFRRAGSVEWTSTAYSLASGKARAVASAAGMLEGTPAPETWAESAAALVTSCE